jgi:hypothetical protein
MVDDSGSAGDFESSNPDRGVPIYYFLKDQQEGPLSIEILDAAGAVVRTYSSEEGDFEQCLLANKDPRRPFELKYPARAQGLNKWTWDMQRTGVHCIEDAKVFAGFDGAVVPPGDYRARVTVGGFSQERAFSLAPDPRVSASPEEISTWTERVNETAALLDTVLRRLGEARKAQGQIEALMADYPEDKELQQAGASAVAAIQAWDAQLVQPLHETYEDEDAWETMLTGQIRYLTDVISGTGAPVTDGAMQRLADLKAEWAKRQTELEAINTGKIAPINNWARDRGVTHVAAPGQ